MIITPVPVLKDNYSYILEGEDVVGVVDPGEAEPVIRKLEQKGLKPDYIFNTHHHWDHVSGNGLLQDKYKVQLVAPASEKDRITGINIPVTGNTMFNFGQEPVRILETPGHTRGAVCFYFPQSGVLFSGDTLFSMGCGRLFEGTAQIMWDSLAKIKSLPGDTLLYCGHEYTQTNGLFCLSVEPENADLLNRMTDVKRLRDNSRPTIPSTLETEMKTNVFLRAKNAEDFGRLRTLKDNF